LQLVALPFFLTAISAAAYIAYKKDFQNKDIRTEPPPILLQAGTGIRTRLESPPIGPALFCSHSCTPGCKSTVTPKLDSSLQNKQSKRAASPRA